MEEPYIAEKTLYESDASSFGEMTVDAMIDWLRELAEDQPCGMDEMLFKVTQWGDHWDGYGEARIEIVRRETLEEARQREAEERARTAASIAAREAEEREQLRRLQIKYASR
jgi:hypothetical protein